jgi:hypothetical protein
MRADFSTTATVGSNDGFLQSSDIFENRNPQFRVSCCSPGTSEGSTKKSPKGTIVLDEFT